MADQNEIGQSARLAAIVIVVAMLAWMGVSFVGGKLGLPERYAFLADLFALAAFAFALIVLLRVRRQNRLDKSRMDKDG